MAAKADINKQMSVREWASEREREREIHLEPFILLSGKLVQQDLFHITFQKLIQNISNYQPVLSSIKPNTQKKTPLTFSLCADGSASLTRFSP